ncbi:GntR family transcriptional regulator [Pseudofrankia sp. BMG5.37]|uniref:FadR/GntR family transcriptional regulator n=1 Tax=Pseudofrankia sp. BMG5.37 TaxID=3050035 RepID=UPI002893C82B|nr:GntR family transcriptional regulator [Pseudofrankia sp. BMG5.37]MDT3443292.1 GntR family transcriptional regulator [Pseudofrankia sp. BMG5.37]
MIAQPADVGSAGADRPARAPREAKVSHLVAMELRRQILSGELVADQQLATEAELTATFDVSRETVREALRVLESQSLVEVRRGRGGGAVVRRPGLASIGRYLALLLQLRGTTLADLEEARAVLEPPLAERFAVRCSAADLHALGRLHDQERTAEDDPLAFVMAAAGFDTAVTERSGNRSVGLVAGIFRDVYAGQVYAAVAPSGPASAEEIARTVTACHSAFLDAARRRDGAMARRAWADYLAVTSPLLVDRGRSRQSIDVVPLWRPRNDSAAAGQSSKPGQPNRLAATVADEIRARIAEGRLGDGDRLPGLPDLAAQFGVSRPTLREALRTLEMEFLVDLRAGDRNGPQIRHPSPRVAVQLASTVMQARHATMGDFFRAVAMIEPSMIELAVARMDPASLATLRSFAADLAARPRDASDLSEVWTTARKVIFGATRNPALAVIAEVLQWVRTDAQANPAGSAITDPAWLAETHRLVALFPELVAAFEAEDGVRAARIWAQSLDANSPDIESSELGRRLVIDLIGEKEGVPWTSLT